MSSERESGRVTAMETGPGATARRRHGRVSAHLVANRCVDLLRVSSALCTAAGLPAAPRR
ncbi:hypothetical protein K7472_22620 [Streptomyces sp. PTM05]|uniref:Uncharacterized protein n=1 Tax=Streptantibioticus parmotrematis TaxID=2873249 RepID=A0ABS7QXE8_9ACTN|nr:hypothetical protein [Streptantibioticus parmotrematis]MBY8887613.1 hypothetical protein [Streptantibioticus parmotrematis]